MYLSTSYQHTLSAYKRQLIDQSITFYSLCQTNDVTPIKTHESVAYITHFQALMLHIICIFLGETIKEK